MRTIAIATASAMALLSVSAFAQTPTSPVHPLTPAAAPAAAPQPPKPNPLAQPDVSKIIGTAVYGSDGKEIGDVSTVLMKPDNKKIDRLVLRSGGVLGIGGHYVALPLDQFSWNAKEGALTVAKTGKDIDKMAEWKAPASTEGVGSSQPPASKAVPPSNSGR